MLPQIKVFETNGYQWEGPAHLPVRLSGRFLLQHVLDGDLRRRIILSSYTLRFVRYECLWDELVYARADGLLWFSWLYWWTLARLEEIRCQAWAALYLFAMRRLGWRFQDGERYSWRGFWKGWRA